MASDICNCLAKVACVIPRSLINLAILNMMLII
jgi:hypothetical protein